MQQNIQKHASEIPLEKKQDELKMVLEGYLKQMQQSYEIILCINIKYSKTLKEEPKIGQLEDAPEIVEISEKSITCIIMPYVHQRS